MLNALRKLQISDRDAQGVRLLFSPDVARHLHTEAATGYQALDNRSAVWGHTLSILGISHAYTCEAPAAPATALYAAGGQTLRAFSDQDLKTLLSGPLLLDASSAQVLVERGFGEHIGIRAAEWAAQEDSAYAYEHIHESNPEVFGVAHPRMTASRCALRLLKINPTDPNAVLSSICRADHAELFPGSLCYSNSWGGRIFSVAYPLDGKHQFFMGFFNTFRRIFIQRQLFRLAPQAALAMVEERPMHFYRVRTAEGELFAAFNVSYDRTEKVVIKVPRGQIRTEQLFQLEKDGAWKRSQVHTVDQEDGVRLERPVSLGPLEGLFLFARVGGPTRGR